MTEQEQKAIKWMKNVRDDAVVTLDHIAKEEPNVSPMLYAGRKEKAETIIKGFEELEQYRAIGTPEECRTAVDKQRKKKILNPLTSFSLGTCPVCSAHQLGRFIYCSRCGQKLDWSDEE